jgi:hypothetical protein
MSHRTERRHRKKRREREDIPLQLSSPREADSGRVGSNSLFSDPALTQADLRLIRRAVNQGWDVLSEMRGWIIEETMKIVRQVDGLSENESDRNSILACVAMFDMYKAGRRVEQKRIQDYAGCSKAVSGSARES